MKMRTLFTLLAVVLVGAPAAATAQGYSFYGPPAPSDFSTDMGNLEIAEDTDGDTAGVPGLGIFARKPFKFTFSVRQGYDSNVFTTRTDPTESWYTNWAAGILYEFGGPRLKLRSSLGGGLTYYYTRPGDPVDFNGNFSLGATYLATPRLTLSIDTTTAYLSQPDISILGTTDRVDGDYLYSSTTVSAAYAWTEKFSTVAAYTFGTVYYLENNLNDTQGYITQTASISGRWLILPKTTGVLEYRVNPITYYKADLDSLGQFFLVGVDQIFNPRMRWSGRVGAEMRFNNNPVDGQSTYFGPYFESNFSWQFGRASNLAWTARYGTLPSGLTNVTQSQTLSNGLVATHQFTRRLSGNLGVNWNLNYYDQPDVIPDFYENIFQVSAGLNFAVNRFISLSAGYQYTIDVAPDAPEREYNRSVAFAGANFAF